MMQSKTGKKKIKSPDKFLNNFNDSISGVDELIPKENDGRLKKRSLLLPKEREAAEFIDDVENDDEKEKRAHREAVQAQEKKEREEQAKKAQKTATVNVLTNLSKDELEEHYSRCIQMCNQNKVNSKNAFKLQLIDYMKLIFMNRSQKTDNLSLMSCTLDASAKIYAYRVDKVYSDMMKVMSCKDWTKEKDEEEASEEENKEEANNDKDDDSDSEAEQGNFKKKKKKDDDDEEKLDLEKMLCSESQLEKGDNEGESLFKDRTTLPKDKEYFLECPISDPDGELILNGPLFAANEELGTDNLLYLGPRYTGDFDCIHPADVIPDYGEMHKHFHMIGEGAEEMDINKSLVYDVTEPEVLPDHGRQENDSDDGMDVAPQEPDFVGDYDDCFSEDEIEPDPLDPTKLVDGKNGTIEKSFSVKAMSKLVTVDPDEYTFFDNSKLSCWAGPTHWNIKGAKRKHPKIHEGKKADKKKKSPLNWNLAEVAKDYEDTVNVTLAKRTIATWSKAKCLEPEDIGYTQRQLLSLFHNDRLLYVDKEFSTKGIYMCGKEDQEGKFDSLRMPEEFSSAPAPEVEEDNFAFDGGDDHHNDADSDNGRDNDCGGSPIPGPSEETPTPFAGLELIPAPPKVNKINISYAKSQKKIDMKLLKRTIWRLMGLESDSQVNNPEENEIPKDNKPVDKVKFSSIFEQLFKELPSEEATALSFPIAFMALLHLANEKSLKLTGDSNYEDLIVELAVPPVPS